MTLVFIGNRFKYEIEAVMKLFFPLERFKFEYDENNGVAGEYCRVSVLGNRLEITVSHNEKTVVKALENVETSEHELTLCRLLYNCLTELTGFTPPWGCLTGIRPVKTVNSLMRNGFDKAGVIQYLGEKYYVSECKSALAYDTAVTQAKGLSNIGNNSFSLYIGIPFCPSRCSYCSFVSHSIENENAKKLIPQYVSKLADEISATLALAFELGLELQTIYIGGGTPTSLSAENLDFLLKTVRKSLNVSEICEYTVEAGRCDTITKEKLLCLKENGVNRISVNPQTLNNSVLKNIGRNHTVEEFYTAFRLARSLGFGNINADVIAGLPTDDLAGFKHTIDELIKLSPENITVHTLTLKRASNLFQEKQVHISAQISEMIAYSHEKLTENEYFPYYLYRQKNTVGNHENVGYCKAGFENLYNVFIMEESQTILSCGAGGSTKLTDISTGKIERFFNYKFPYEYISRYDGKIAEKLYTIRNFFKEK